MERPALEQAWIKHDDTGFATHGSLVHANYKKRPRACGGDDVTHTLSVLTLNAEQEGQSPGLLLLEERQSPGSQCIP